MTISNVEEIKCSCGHSFSANLISAISVSDNPSLKEDLLLGEINIVSCSECGNVFYAENFILYHDSANELIAFVYPLNFQNQAGQCEKKMHKEFGLAIENFEDKQKINYSPIIMFGIEELILLLRSEQNIEDEETILKYMAPKFLLNTVKITSSASRKLGIPKILPVPKSEKNISAKSLISGLQILVKCNPHLSNYVKCLEKMSRHKKIAEEIAKEKFF